jgi:hypothetical protein
MYLIMEIQDGVDVRYGIVHLTHYLIDILFDKEKRFKEIQRTNVDLTQMRYRERSVQYYESVNLLSSANSEPREHLEDNHWVITDYLPKQGADEEIDVELDELVIYASTFRWSFMHKHVDRYCLTEPVRFSDLRAALKERAAP